MAAPVTVTLLRLIEREGTIHRPGDRVTVPFAEAASMIRMGFALPDGAMVEVDRRPIRGHFVRERWTH
jgi:hypothetical protein